jgi:peptidoglycan/xylan/chitin deacetylase (PgdA/CDA1 family)
LSPISEQAYRWTGGARYLLRFDDICPTMNAAAWRRIEAIVRRAGVRPIVAVVPRNRDPELEIDPPEPGFWARVARWQADGWAIGQHGFEHRYVNTDAGILGLTRRSEFAGLDLETQRGKIVAGIEVFGEHGIRANCWVAPSHSFDWTTVAVLASLGQRVISDGIALRPFVGGKETVWVPQQMARIRRLPLGIWTFCYHPNRMGEADFVHLEHMLGRLASRMIGLDQAIALALQPAGAVDHAMFSARRVISGFKALNPRRDA